MTKHQLASMIDHTLLRPDATYADLEREAAVALEYGTYSLCVKPCDVARARRILDGSDVKIITVVGFPLGCNVPMVKVAEAQAAIDDGAQELDMVINLTALKSGDDAQVAQDIQAVTHAAGTVPVKVIIETCLLTDAEKVRACRLSVSAGALFVKTSTGFAAGGATPADIRLMRQTVGQHIGVKASGGIRTFTQAMELIGAGASRIGCSATRAIVDACHD